MTTIIPPAISEKTIQPTPRPRRLSLMNLKPMTKIKMVMAAKATDMAIVAIQYKTSNKSAKGERASFIIILCDGFITDKSLS